MSLPADTIAAISTPPGPGAIGILRLSGPESIAVLEHLSAILPLPDIRVSIMSQYTPEFAADCPQKSLHRRLTDFEYQSVLEAADRLGIVGYRQSRASATGCYTPEFGEGKL